MKGSCNPNQRTVQNQQLHNYTSRVLGYKNLRNAHLLQWPICNPGGPLTLSVTTELNLLGIVPKQVCNFSSLSIYCLGCKTISRQAARRLIILHPKQNTETELKWNTCWISYIKMHKNATA